MQLIHDVEQYDYPLPRDLIAQHPLKHRADARLMVVNRRIEAIDHYHVRDLPQLLREEDRLVLNNTKVIPARLIGYRTVTGGRWQGLFLASDPRGIWKLLAKSRGKLSPGETITLLDCTARDDSRLHLLARHDDGVWIAQLEPVEDAYQVLDRVGRVPLPHYIRRGEMLEADRRRYQTVFAQRPGSVAAPTAGLHFTPELLEDLQRHGVGVSWITLHVGIDTFRPITTPTIDHHPMHCEWAELSERTAEELRHCRLRHGRIVAVGSTSVRTLETSARNGDFQALCGMIDLYIRPPYHFRAVDALLTNFHLPRTTLLVLARTFGGDALMRKAYDEAIREKYRFFSYGDAMLIV